MNKNPNPEMLILAREVRGLTQAQLAEISGIDQGSISRYEGGLKPAPDYELGTIAKALGFPTDFFYQQGERHGAESGEIFHRKRRSLPVGQLKRIHAQLNIFRLNMMRLLEPVDPPRHFDIPQYNVREFDGDIENIASVVRAAWRMPSGPVQNLVARLEAAYCFIHSYDFSTNLIDETVQWCEPMRPVILVNSRAPGDRLRFSLGHALGHLVLHHDREPYEGMEDEADKFAAAFLMPAEDIKQDFESVTIERMLQLKPYWKVSMQALIHRAYELNIINQTRYTSLFQMLSREGYRKDEPFPLPLEQPTSLNKVLDLYRGERLKFQVADIADLVGISEHDFRSWYLPNEPNLRVIGGKSEQIKGNRKSSP